MKLYFDIFLFFVYQQDVKTAIPLPKRKVYPHPREIEQQKEQLRQQQQQQQELQLQDFAEEEGIPHLRLNDPIPVLNSSDDED